MRLQARLEAVLAVALSCEPPSGLISRIIAIDGPGGAGKSTLAAELSDRLDGCEVIHTDDFATGEPGDRWWRRLLEQALLPAAYGDAARYQRYDWPSRRLAEWRFITPSPTLVLEGVGSSRRELRHLLALKVWVSTPRPERLRGGLERDGEETSAQWLKWMAEEDRYVARERPDQTCDVWVSGEG